MIRTFGLYWRVSHVNWGQRGPGQAGTLLGSAIRGDVGTIVDFRSQRGIYALYSDFDLVYIGQTGGGNSRLFLRLRGHLSDHLAERWDRFSWFGMRWVTAAGGLSADTVNATTPTTNALNIMEAVVIAISEPRLNLQRGNWNSAGAQQYFQYIPEESDDE
ncbi:MAG: GIY-YIG nuclease family protein [Bryobacterales bacterium]|nr:GIY-YIG nuclease family protein [Bryobacterales bacterium]